MINQPNLFVITIVTVLATIFSSFTLWLLDSWIKYPLFVFEILTIIVLYLIVSGYNIKLNINRTKIENFHLDLTVDAFLVVLSVGLLFLNILGMQGGVMQLIMVLLLTSILPGYALLNIFNLNRYFSRLELLVLSYVFSFIFTGLITLIFVFLNENVRLYCIITYVHYIGVSFFSKTPEE